MPEIPENVDLRWIARTLAAIQADVPAIKADMRTMKAVVDCLDGSQTTLLEEVRAARSQLAP